jgi:hypothetical protein
MKGPLFRIRTQLAVAAGLREQGYGLLEARQLSKTVDDDLIHHAATVADVSLGAIGDGTILQAILDFFKSPVGQALIAALIKLLTGL